MRSCVSVLSTLCCRFVVRPTSGCPSCHAVSSNKAGYINDVEVCTGNWNSRFPFFLWEFHGNGNRKRAFREWEWELSRVEWEGMGIDKMWQNSDSHCSFSHDSHSPSKKTKIGMFKDLCDADDAIHPVCHELSDYVNLTVAKNTKFWSDRLKQFPKLCMGVLNIPANSAPCERVLSTAGCES